MIPSTISTTQGIAPCRRVFSDSCCFDAFLILVVPMHLTAYWASPAERAEDGEVWRLIDRCRGESRHSRPGGPRHDIYFLNRLLKASRASVAVRGVTCGETSGRDPFVPFPLGSPSRATVTLGEKRLH